MTGPNRRVLVVTAHPDDPEFLAGGTIAQPQLVVDIGDTMDLKLKAIRCHTSQIRDAKAVEARMRNRAATLGKEQGYSYAEGFDTIVVPG